MDSPSSSLLHPSSSSTPPATSQHPSASSTAPQIRSRITVVCAECKRLKLKCDRRTPCGSCTKRDTVVRCIYSPAAAEKVDLHSLNNRLIQVESFISMISLGQQQLPAFQSSYLLPNSSTASSSSTPASSFNLNFSNHHQPSHQHHHHYAPPQSHPSSNSIALSPQDFASIWLDGLDLGVSWLPPSSSPHHQQQLQVYPNGASAGYIKLEPSTIDAALSLPLNGADNNSHFSQQPSRAASPLNSSRHRRSQQHSSVQLLLPALSIYYPVPTISPPGTSPSSSSAFPHQSSASNTLHLTQQQPQYTKPQVTPALLLLLPSLQRCKRLLHKAREVSHVRPIPFEPTSSNGGGAWKAFEGRCIMLLSGGMTEERERERERKEKAREAKRARQIYFGGIHGLQSDDAEMDDANGTKNKDVEEQSASSEGQSLTFFATMCAVLAIGSYYSSSSGDSNPHATESPAFFYALSQQALGVWDTHVSSTSGSSSSASVAADEAERMDYLLACLVGVEYLMLSRSDEEKERENGPTTSSVHSLVGRLVNAHRTMGLGKDTSSASRKSKNGLGVPSTVAMSKRLEKEKIKDEWKRMVLWQVMYCDLFVADVLGHQPFIPSYSFSAKLPSCSSSPSSEISIGTAEQELSEDEFQQSHDDMQHDGYDSSFNTRNPNSSRQQHRQQHQQPQSTPPDPNNLEAYEEVHPYLGARYRLTQLAQAVKDRIAHPDCCCGYTLDQAATLEDEIGRWYAGLPASLKAAISTASSAATASSSLPPDRTLPRSPFHDLLPSDSTGGDSAGRNFGADKAALAQSCELAIMVNMLIVKIYTPFLRHAASTSATATNGGNATQSFSSASVGGISSSACQAMVHAAQAILRAGKVLCAAPSSKNNNPADGQDVVLPSLFDYYPLDKIIFDAVVICAHAGLTGKAATFAFDAGVLLEDVYSGLELLSDMFAGNGMGAGLGEKQKRVVEALYKRVQHRGGNASLLKRKHDQVDIAGAFGASSMYPSANGAAGGSNEETMMPGFDFMNPDGNTQYQPNGLPIAQQQQQHAGLMDTSASSSRPSIIAGSSIPAGTFPQDRLQRTEEGKNELQFALTSARHTSAARHADKEKSKEQDQQDRQLEKEKGQKHSKKSHVYPSVGIRVRPGKDSSSTSSRPRQHSVSGPAAGQHTSLMATVQQRPLAESVLTFQQQQKQKLNSQGMSTSGNQNHRSRSSSISYLQASQAEQQPTPMEYSLPFGSLTPSTSDVMDLQSMHEKSLTIPDSATRQAQQQQQLAPEQSSFTSRPFEQARSMYDRTQQQSYDPSVAIPSSVTHTDGMNYGNAVSSPFSPPGGPPSSTGSPFTSASSGHPPTPTFTAHHPTPPVFGPQASAAPPTSSSTIYFLPPNFGGSYTRSPPSELSGHHRDGSLADMGIDQTMVSSTPVYDKSQQQQQVAMYDMKPPVGTQPQHHHMLQQQHIQRQSMGPPYEDQDMSGQLSMAIPPHPSWPSGHQQQPPAPRANQNYWDMGTEFRFHP